MSQNKKPKIDAAYQLSYEEHGNEFVSYDPSDPRGTPFESGAYVQHGDAVTVSEDRNSITFVFQHGTHNDAGSNGVYEDALLQVAADMLRFKNGGPLCCDEYTQAITSVEAAIQQLGTRAAKRQAASMYGAGAAASDDE